MAQDTGVLPDREIEALVASGAIRTDTPLDEGQVQPASLDLRLGPVAYRIQAGFLPGKGRAVASCIAPLKMTELDLTKPQLLEKGAVYLIPLQESLALPEAIMGAASPKSSTGRLDIFVRLITDGSITYDTVNAGYNGPLYVEVSPLTFSVVVRAGDRLNQLRLHKGNVRVTDDELMKLHHKTPLMCDKDMPLLADAATQANQGMWFGINLHGDATQPNPIIGYRAKHHTQPIDLAKIGGYHWRQFWEPITRNDCCPLILYPEEFYIFASQQGITVPPQYAAELVAYDTRVGEIRVHYAGFFDPGFGYDTSGRGNHGTTAVLEVRAHDVPCVLEHGQPIGRFLYEKLLQPPTKLYGAEIGSNYAGQSLKLAKQFLMD